MKKVFSTELHDYWLVKATAPFNRLAYGFHIIGEDGTEVFYGDKGFIDDDSNQLGKNSNIYFRMPYFHEVDRFKAPDWVKETVGIKFSRNVLPNGDPANDPEGTLPWNSKRNPGRDEFRSRWYLQRYLSS